MNEYKNKNYNNKQSSKMNEGFKKDNKQSSNMNEGFKRDNKQSSKMNEGFKKDNKQSVKMDEGFKRDYRQSSKMNEGFKRDYKQNSKINEEIKKDYKDIEKDQALDINDECRLEGKNPIIEALKAERTIEKIYINKDSKDQHTKQIIALAKEKKIIINEVDRKRLDEISTTKNHQGAIAITSPYSYVEVDDIINYAKEKNELPFIIILDEITDPNNFGSIIRTAEVFGAHGIIIPKHRAVGLTPSVAKASSGAIEYIKIAKVTNINQTIKYLKDNNIWIAGTDMEDQKYSSKADYNRPIAIIIGNEGNGISRLIKENCDFIVSIPMKGKIQSLNAAVAGAIVMYDVMKDRMS